MRGRRRSGAGGDGAGGDASLGTQAVTGGAHLVARQVTGLAVRSVGLLLLTRFIGPANYGVYAASLAIATLIAALCGLGSAVYLIRFREERVDAVEEQIFSFLAVTSALAVGVGVPAVLAVRDLVAIDGAMVLVVLLALLPVNVLWVPAQARLERELRYRALARIEFVGDVVLYAVAVLVAATGAGVWAPVCGYAAWQTWLLVTSYASSGFRPRWRWEWPLLRAFLGYGSTYSLSFLANRLEAVLNPFIVGRYVGAVGVGYVALALRLTENLGFVGRTVNKVALPTLAKMQGDRARIERAHAEAMVVKIIGVGVPCLGVALTMPVVLPLLIGDEWDGVATVFPLIAASTLLASPFALHGKFLNVLGRNMVVAAAQIGSVVVLGILGVVLVPRLGPEGFGWATIGAVAPLVGLHWAVRPVLTPRYGPAIRWCAALVPPLFISLVGSPLAALLAVPTVAVVLFPASRRDIRQLAGMVGRLRPDASPSANPEPGS